MKSVISEISKLDFSGKGESFVEQKFITPLLEALGYEKHKDYEVIRHGDENASFKLKFPPVEQGAKAVKHYNPDYVPTIRKKMFWIIEAKSPNVNYPFEYKYLVQGLQYCLHPEIQAQYLVVSNGLHTSIYAPLEALVLDREIYEPILSFSAPDLITQWEDIYSLLSVERIRDKLEVILQQMYEKIALSSLDEDYPKRLARSIILKENIISTKIKKYVNNLKYEQFENDRLAWQQELQSLSYQELYPMLNMPLGVGKTVANYYVEKAVLLVNAKTIFLLLVDSYDKQTIFRKEQTFVGLCVLYYRCNDEQLKKGIITFLEENADRELSLLNQAECATLRFMRKFNILNIYPVTSKLINEYLKTAPELERFVNVPNSFHFTIAQELIAHDAIFQKLLGTNVDDLKKICITIEAIENRIDEDFRKAKKKLIDSERQLGGYDTYGMNGHHWVFRTIIKNFFSDTKS